MTILISTFHVTSAIPTTIFIKFYSRIISISQSNLSNFLEHPRRRAQPFLYFSQGAQPHTDIFFFLFFAYLLPFSRNNSHATFGNFSRPCLTRRNTICRYAFHCDTNFSLILFQNFFYHPLLPVETFSVFFLVPTNYF